MANDFNLGGSSLEITETTECGACTKTPSGEVETGDTVIVCENGKQVAKTITLTVDTDTFVVGVDNGDGTATFTNVDGSQVTVSTLDTDTFASVVNNNDGTATITNVDGSTVDVCTDCRNTTVVDNGDGSVTITEPDGTPVVVDANGNYMTIADNSDGTATATNVDGTLVTLSTEDTFMVGIDNGNGTATFTNVDGTIFDVCTDCRNTSVVDNGDGSYTFTEPDGTPVTISSSSVTEVANADGSITYTHSDGTSWTTYPDTFGTTTYTQSDPDPDNGGAITTTITHTPAGGGTPVVTTIVSAVSDPLSLVMTGCDQTGSASVAGNQLTLDTGPKHYSLCDVTDAESTGQLSPDDSASFVTLRTPGPAQVLFNPSCRLGAMWENSGVNRSTRIMPKSDANLGNPTGQPLTHETDFQWVGYTRLFRQINGVSLMTEATYIHQGGLQTFDFHQYKIGPRHHCGTIGAGASVTVTESLVFNWSNEHPDNFQPIFLILWNLGQSALRIHTTEV